MKVLVAGGAGFIGNSVCRSLLSQGHTVVCLDNFLTGNKDNIKDLLDNSNFTLIDEDVTNAPSVTGLDLVLHLASPASPVHYQKFAIETMLANSIGTQRLLTIALSCKARFVFASTSEVYGDPLEHPQRETYWGNVNPVGVRACYDESKRFGEALTTEYQRKYGLNTSIVRIFNTYGPRMDINDGRVIPEFIRSGLSGNPFPVFGSGKQTRSFCYVSDLVEALLLVAMDDSTNKGIFNIGNPYEVTIIEIAEMVSECLGIKNKLTLLPSKPDDPARRRPDIYRISSRYGWAPKVSLSEGIRQTVNYFKAEYINE